jgi:hypothetical protein
MTTKLTVAVAAAALVLGIGGVAKAGEGSVDSNNFGNSYYGWNGPGTYSNGYGYRSVEPGYAYAPRSYYNDDADVMTGYSVRRPAVEPYSTDDDED